MALFADMPIPIQFSLAFVTMLGLIGATVWAVRRFADAPRGSQSRLAVVDYASVSGRRRLILVRRDNVEHLVMIGGATDVVVESNIAAAPLQTAVPVLHRAGKAPDPYPGDPRRRAPPLMIVGPNGTRDKAP
jgi:flagellar protein FliO/FliZ